MIHTEAVNLPRVIACNASVKLATGIVPVASAPTIDKQEGIAAHYVAASVLSGKFTDPLEFVERQTPNGVWVSPEIAENVAIYVNYCTEHYYQVPTIQTWVENTVTFEVPGARIGCRPDFIGFDSATNTLFIEDFKYGHRLVEAEMNWTLIADAIGAMLAYNLTPDHVVLAISQPRPFHPDGKRREWRITGDYFRELYGWLSRFFVDQPQNLVSGPHCSGCLAVAFCPAARQAEFNAVDVASTVVIRDDMGEDDIRQALLTIDRASDALELRAEALRELAKTRIRQGKIIGDYVIEQTYGHYAVKAEFKDPAVLKVLTGVDVTDTKLVSKTEMIRRGVSQAVADLITYRPTTGEKLVRRNVNNRAKRLFDKKP